MIRVNLGKTRLDSIEITDKGGGSSAGVDIKEILIKVLVLVGGFFALQFYESQNLEKISNQLAKTNAELFSLQSTLETKNQELGSLGSIEQDSKALQDKMKLLKKLSRLRLRELKSLDYVQSVVPQRVWLQNLDIQGESLIIKGNGRDETDVTLFMKRLESGGYFSDVILIQDSQVVLNGNNLREFEISARAEVIN